MAYDLALERKPVAAWAVVERTAEAATWAAAPCTTAAAVAQAQERSAESYRLRSWAMRTAEAVTLGHRQSSGAAGEGSLADAEGRPMEQVQRQC